MSDLQLDPYLFFNGNCREAMEFYKDIFGGELKIMTMDGAPGTSPEDKDKVMHALLDGELRFMASDSSKASDKMTKVELSISSPNEEKLRGFFDKLADGGKVEYPLKKEFWGDTFGKLTDKYGIEWMINITAIKQ